MSDPPIIPRPIIPLPGRAVLSVGGSQAAAFLQGLISADSENLRDGQCVPALLLTPQGRWLHDFFLLRHGSRFLIECERSRADDLIGRLSRYLLGRDVTIAPTPLHVAAWPDAAIDVDTARGVTSADHVIEDPRPVPIGLRLWRGKPFAERDDSPYDQQRLQWGLSDGSRDLEAEKSLPAEYNLDHLGFLDWNKGCYMGQEGVARIHHRGRVRKRILPFTMEGKESRPPPPASEVRARGTLIGVTRSARRFADRTHGLVLVRLEEWRQAGPRFECPTGELRITIPDWLAEAEKQAG